MRIIMWENNKRNKLARHRDVILAKRKERTQIAKLMKKNNISEVEARITLELNQIDSAEINGDGD